MRFFLIAGGISLAYCAALLVLIEAGRRAGRARLELDPEKGLSGLGPIEGSVLGLFGLLLAFSFGGGVSRFNERTVLVINESNAVGTVWLRMDGLPAADQPAIRKSFRDYVNARVETQAVDDETKVLEDRLYQLKDQLWKGIQAVYKRDGYTSSGNFLMASLNDLFEIGDKRLAYRRYHMPIAVFIFLLALGLVGGLMAGMALAGAKNRNWLYPVGFALINGLTIYLIIDIEYPRHGLIRIDAVHQVLIDAAERLR